MITKTLAVLRHGLVFECLLASLGLLYMIQSHKVFPSLRLRVGTEKMILDEKTLGVSIKVYKVKDEPAASTSSIHSLETTKVEERLLQTG